MPRTATSKKTPKRTTRKSTRIARALPASAVLHSVAHGHSSYDHSKELKDKRLDDKSQRLIIWLGVSGVMAAIVIAWILSLSQLLGPDAFSATDKDSQSKVDFIQLKEELQSTLSEVRGSMEELKELSTPTATVTPTVSPTVTPTESPAVTSTTTPNTLPK